MKARVPKPGDIVVYKHPSNATQDKKFEVIDVLDNSVALEEVPPFDTLHWYSLQKFYSFFDKGVLEYDHTR